MRKIVLAVVICTGAVMLAAGIALGETEIVCAKAIRICLECIGIG